MEQMKHEKHRRTEAEKPVNPLCARATFVQEPVSQYDTAVSFFYCPAHTLVAVTKVFHGCTDHRFTLSRVTFHAKHANLNCL